jgi:choline kinase
MIADNAIILAAGQGSRLLPITKHIPKCLIEINNTTILENALNNLSHAGVKNVFIVVGYLEDLIRKKIGDNYKGMSIFYVENPKFSSTNNMFSLLLGMEQCKAPVWIIESDIFFDTTILDRSEDSKDYDVLWYVDSQRKDLDGAYIIADPDGKAKALEIIRDLSYLQQKHHKSVGILKVNAKGLIQISQWLNEAVGQGKTNLFYDLILAEHIHEISIRIMNVSHSKWFEIDTDDDLNNAKKIFY